MIWRKGLSAASAAIAWRDAFLVRFFLKTIASRHVFDKYRRNRGVDDAALNAERSEFMLS